MNNAQSFNKYFSNYIKKLPFQSVKTIIFSHIHLASFDWRLLVPIMIGLGIGIYFSLANEPPLFIGIALTLLMLGLSIRYRTKDYALMIHLLLVASIGFTSAQFRTYLCQAPRLQQTIPISILKGKISEITPLPHGTRLLIEPLSLANISADSMPTQIRLTTRMATPNLKMGDIIIAKVSLKPPPPPPMIGSYDFARHAYFSQIGATGIILQFIKHLPTHSEQTSFKHSLANIRQTLNRYFTQTLTTTHGSIASALVVGMYQSLPPKVLDAIRISGLAHILSVSGMHLSLVAGCFYFALRWALSNIASLALHYNTHKLAAIGAILGSGLYLIISGQEIAAFRAFLMVSISLIALLLDRNSTSLRAIAWSATLILFLTPEALLHPSFHMSFAAVAALIVSYQVYQSMVTKTNQMPSLLVEPYYTFFSKKIIFYVAGIIASSLIATMATTPFGIYHFHHYSNYGVVANLIGVPLTSFVIMPCTVLALLAHPFGIDGYFLWLLKHSIQLFIKVAFYVTHFPYATIPVKAMPLTALLCFSSALFWFCLWESSIRWLSIILVIIGILLHYFAPLPDILIDQSGKVFAIYDAANKQLLLSSKRYARYTYKTWQAWLGIKKLENIKNNTAQNITHTPDFTYMQRNEKQVLLVSHSNANFCQTLIAKITENHHQLPSSPLEFSLIINLTNTPLSLPCLHSNAIIDKQQLNKLGTHAIWLNRDSLTIKSVYSKNSKRPWHVNS